MAFYNDNLGNYLNDVLNKLDIVPRCVELSAIFARSNIRDLQDYLPQIVYSIFGITPNGVNVGWGLRTTMNSAGTANEFNALNDFLNPTGPMLMFIHRLLNESIKYEFDINLLPIKVAESIRTGHCSQFYSDLVNVDPIRRQITSLSLNAFDFLMLHFVIHGTLPMHKIHPTALYVHNECAKTAYFFLCADYLCNFLPSSPDSIVLPTNICATVKAPQPMQPIVPLKPQRSPKFLKIPNMNLYNSQISNTPTSPTESPRTFAWRSESVLNFFIDIWLRLDVDGVRDLPGTEFIRAVRLLVKQTHAFANSAQMDHTPMSALRKQAQPMMRMRIYQFLNSVIDRWPLDGSFIVVLELWLSYIQPWRYRYELRRHGSNFSESLSLHGFEDFIAENLIIYTQMFIFVLARLDRFDFTLTSNASMLYRVMKVFSQKELPLLLNQAEGAYVSNNVRNLDSPQRRIGQYTRLSNSFDSTWDSSRFYHDDLYTPLFGKAMQMELQRFVRGLYITTKLVEQEIQAINQNLQEQRKNITYLKRFVNFFINDSSTINEKLQKLNDIPDLIKASIRSIGVIFNMDLQSIITAEFENSCNLGATLSSDNSNDVSSGYLDISTLSPMKMRSKVSRIRATVDPALYPIQSHECAVLVRLLHTISTALNQLFMNQMQSYYHRNDIWGRLTRHILYPPMIAQWFDKPNGVNELCEQQLPPRLILRPLGSYKFLVGLTVFVALAYMFPGAHSYAILILLFAFAVYVLIKFIK